ncbi:hypothetical protein NMG60_11009515 [Bertholletia excelsa]
MISDFLSRNHNEHSKMQRCQEYVESLEEERRKILVFQRELPLCLELVTQAIETCKQQLSSTTTECFLGQSECSEQTCSEGPVLEEFIPIKRTSSSSDDDEEESESYKHKNNDKESKNNDKSSKKTDWLKSVQLWNQTPDPPTKQGSPRKVSVVEVKRNGGGAFHPFKKEKGAGPTSAPAVTASSTGETGNGSGDKKEDKKDGQRKSRRNWSPELHRRFLSALQQLGGSHVATPKQIRELMKVDGLTNDEVKSHLQKYRLHTRRPTPSIHNNNNPQPPQFVVVGGIWVPPPEYAAAAASGEAPGLAAPNGVYAPIAAPPPLHPHQAQKKQLPKKSHSDNESPSTSSSTHTSSASPV